MTINKKNIIIILAAAGLLVILILAAYFSNFLRTQVYQGQTREYNIEAQVKPELLNPGQHILEIKELTSSGTTLSNSTTFQIIPSSP